MKKNRKRASFYFTVLVGLAGFKECVDRQNGTSRLCPLQPVSQEQLNWK